MGMFFCSSSTDSTVQCARVSRYPNEVRFEGKRLFLGGEIRRRGFGSQELKMGYEITVILGMLGMYDTM